MVSFDINFDELRKAIGKDISEKELDDVLFDMGMELEDVKDTENGKEIKISITPDRPDMLSLHGLARALRAYMSIAPGMPKYNIKPSDVKIIIDKSVANVRPYTASAVIDNLRFDDQKIKEIIWVQEKLHQTFARGRKKSSIGIYPLEKIKPHIYYFAEDPKKVKFLPLGADREMNGVEILNEHPTGKEFAHLLEGCKKYPFFKDATGSILSMPPIINSEMTGRVTNSTTSVFIECSGWDFNASKQLLNILVAVFQDMGGTIKSVELHYPDEVIVSPNFTPEYRTIYVKDINKTLGTMLSAKECKNLLERMMYDVVIKEDFMSSAPASRSIKDANEQDSVQDESLHDGAGVQDKARSNKEGILEVSIPAFRTDIWHDIDVVDDVARAYGFNNMEPTLTLVPTTGALLKETVQESMLKNIIAGLGYNQTFTLSLTSREDQFTKMALPELPHIRLGTTAEKSLNMMRLWLTPELIKFLSNNRNKPYPQKVFEVNDVIVPNSEKDVLCENKKKVSVVSAHPTANFTEIKQILEYLMGVYSAEFTIQESSHGSFISGRQAEIIVAGKKVGIFGEISPLVLENWGIEMPISALELDFDVFL
jgi:phenylalanyl-tRNA synthetase beta chain